MSKIVTGKGQELYLKAKQLIPGGTQLLSKRPEMYLPGLWPAYYSKAKGCRVWDMDGKEYVDVSYMGVGSCVNGYANDEVDAAACEAVGSGVMCTLNAPEEVYVAEELLKLHPWAGGVRYAKAGGEAMALAVRIARSYSKRDIVLFCGYHGWHDWYLSANISNENALNDQHLSGLEPLGVPKGLAGTMLPFHYNSFEEFDALMARHKGNIGAVVMEPVRNDDPSDGFLEHIRRQTAKEDIVLMFDEITAGFRLCAGGSHKLLAVEPDIAVFAKGMTNGYPLSAVIGRKEIMEAAQGTFISSTFFTERVGLAATLKSMQIYQRDRVWEKQIAYGKRAKAGWNALAEKYDLDISVGGIDPLSHFSFNYENPLAYKTFITQEMLKRGYLASNALYTSAAHSEKVIDDYLRDLGEVFAAIADTIHNGGDIGQRLESGCCHSGFARLV